MNRDFKPRIVFLPWRKEWACTVWVNIPRSQLHYFAYVSPLGYGKSPFAAWMDWAMQVSVDDTELTAWCREMRADTALERISVSSREF